MIRLHLSDRRAGYWVVVCSIDFLEFHDVGPVGEDPGLAFALRGECYEQVCGVRSCFGHVCSELLDEVALTWWCGVEECFEVLSSPGEFVEWTTCRFVGGRGRVFAEPVGRGPKNIG